MKNSNTSKAPKAIRILSIIAVFFGVLTVISGAATLFFSETARAAAGNYVPFVLWFNFLAGFAYVVAGAGLYLWKSYGVGLAGLIAVATVMVFAAFGFHIFSGGAYEMRTVGAMILRSGLWVGIALYARHAWNQGQI